MLNGNDLIALGFKPSKALAIGLAAAKKASKRREETEVLAELKAVFDAPEAYLAHEHWSQTAAALIDQRGKALPIFIPRDHPAPYRIWGEGLEAGALQQMRNAASLPVAVSGALMPDAHQGYGLPIGGVLATENSVIPFAVGVDIACRMKLSVLDIPAADMQRLNEQLVRTLQREPKFGVGGHFDKPLHHDVLDEDWSITPITKHVFEKAREQLGTSGSGNHFVEFGILTISEGSGFGVQGSAMAENRLPNSFPEPRTLNPEPSSFELLPPGQYLALLSHSGSRGSGATIADHYSKLATTLHPELPPELSRLAWLDLDTEPGQEYWAAMNLMGQYAAANHALIHQRCARALGARIIAGVENHHNFAWKEVHGGREVIVHRKGATPAGKGVLGVIPGSMAAPGFVVRGRGEPESLESASHGAGRRMSRTAAREQFRWSHVKPILEQAGVQLLSAGLDEVPGAYKDILMVMAQQADLVEIVARFDPKIVKMADAGEKAED